MSCWDIAMFVVESLFVLATIALVIVTIVMNKKAMEKADKRTNRVIDNSLELNKRQLLPLASIAVSDVTFVDRQRLWVNSFWIKVTNIGLGPVVSVKASAEQSNHTLHGHQAHKKELEDIDVSNALKISEETYFEFERFTDEGQPENFEPFSGPPDEAGVAWNQAFPVNLRVELEDVFQRIIICTFELDPRCIPGGKLACSAGPIYIKKDQSSEPEPLE